MSMNRVALCGEGCVWRAPNRRIAALTAGAILAAGFAHGANPSEVYAQALRNDPQLAAVRAGTAARKQAVAISRALLLPRIAANASASKTTVRVDGTQTNPGSADFGGPVPDREVDRRNWGAGVSQPVLDLPSWFGYRGAQARARQAQADLEAASQGLVTRIAEAYLNVLRGDAALESFVAAEEAVGRQLEQVQQRFDVGLVAITDVLEAKAEYDNAVVNRIQAEGNHDIFFEGLRTITANPVTAVDRLADSLPIVDPVPADEEEWVDTALVGNHRIHGARQAVAAAERDLSGQLAGHLPTITASANYGASTGSQAFGGLVFPTQPSDNITYSLNLNAPIFQGLRNHASVKQARHNLEQARQQLIREELTVARDTRNLFRAVQTEVVRVGARAEAIKSSESALEATQTGYEVGTRNIVDVLLAQRRLFAAQYDYANSRYDYVLNLLRLKESAGVLGPADLEELSTYTIRDNAVTPLAGTGQGT